MIPEDIRQYLEITRSYFQESEDATIAHYLSFAKQKNIDVIVIWSNEAKNEIVKSGNNRVTMIWDTNYWTYLYLYYQNMLNLSHIIETKPELVQYQLDVVWSDLFRICLKNNVENYPQSSFFLSKYYLQYGKVSPGGPILTGEDMIVFSFAKIYVFFHEVSHLTAYTDDRNGYIVYINQFKLFLNVMGDNIYHFFPELQGENKNYLDDVIKRIQNDELPDVDEIIMDARALSTMMINYVGSDEKASSLFCPFFMKAIQLICSYNLRLRQINDAICEFIYIIGIEKIELKTLSTFIREFFFRDRISEAYQQFLLIGYERQYNVSVISNLKKANIFNRKVPKLFDDYLQKRLDKLFETFTSVQSQLDFIHNIDIEQLKQINRFLLFYNDEIVENNVNMFSIWESIKEVSNDD